MATTGGPGEVGVAAVQLSWLERLPWRRIVQTALFVGIVAFVVVALIRTLTVPSAERYSAEQWKGFVVAGVAEGAIIAMIALGYSLVYGILRMINFAHGEVFMMGAYGSFFFADAYAKSGFLDTNTVVAVAILLLVAMLVSVIVAVLLERIAYRRLRNAPRLVPLITAIGASLFLQNTARGLFGARAQGYPKPSALAGSWEILGTSVQRMDLVIVLVSIVSMLVLQAFVSRTRTGRSMRAVAEDKEIASLMGVDVDRVVVTTFVIGGIFAGFAGVLFAMNFEQVAFFSGFRPGISAFTAAVLGGIGSIGGAALGGFLLGALKSLGPALLLGFHVPSPFQLEDVITFGVLVLVLIFRPAGLLGSGEEAKL